MSFLSELRMRKNKLKETETVVTSVDGQRFIERGNGEAVKKLEPCNGFVVDTKPDNVPAQIVEHLYIGSQDCTASNVLESYNIKHVLSLGIDVDVEVCQKYVQCLDLPETDITPILRASLPFIHEAVLNRQNVLVHCNAGVSRTSMVAIAYLMQYEGMQCCNAYDLVKEKRPAIQPNAGFKRQLMNLDLDSNKILN